MLLVSELQEGKLYKTNLVRSVYNDNNDIIDAIKPNSIIMFVKHEEKDIVWGWIMYDNGKTGSIYLPVHFNDRKHACLSQLQPTSNKTE